MKQIQFLYSLLSFLMIISNNLLGMELYQKSLHQDKNYQFVKALQMAIKEFNKKNNLPETSQFQIVLQKDFYLQAHQELNTVLTVFKMPHASVFSTISNQEANQAHQFLKVYDIQNQNGICSIMFKCFNRQLLPVTNEQAGFLLIAPLLKETIRKTELVGPVFLNSEQKKVLCQNSKHAELIIVQRNECKAFFESEKLMRVFKIESHQKTSESASQAIHTLNYFLYHYHQSGTSQKEIAKIEAHLLIDKVCDFALHEGFVLGMVVHTNAGPQKIEEIQVGDMMLSKDLENDIQVVCPVTQICKEIIPCYAEIVLDNETIITALGQKFYLEIIDEWVTAHDLIQSPELQTYFPEQILEIRQVNESIEVYKLTVAHEHNFYVTEKQLLAHNFIPMVTVAGVAIPSLVIPIAKATGAAVCGWIGAMFFKSFSPSKKDSDNMWKHYHEHLEKQYQHKIDKKQHHKADTKAHEKQDAKKDPNSKANKFISAGSPGGPGGPNDPNDPKKNGNNNNYKKPNDNDKKDNKKNEEKKNKDNEQKKNELDGELDRQKSKNQLSAQEISKHIIENEKAILDGIEPSLKELVKNGNAVKGIRHDAFKIHHIFSKKHINGALSKICNNITQISGKIIQEVTECSRKIIAAVSKADKLNVLEEGKTTYLQAIINDLPIEIHVHIQNGIIFSFDAYVNLSGNRPGIFISLD